MDGSTLVRLFCALGVIALLLWGLAAVLRYEPFMRVAAGSRRRLIYPIETTPLSSGASLHVVKILDQYYVLGSSGASVSMLCPIAKEGAEAHVKALRARKPASLRSILRALGGKTRKPPIAGGNRTKVR